ncbi:unnamed protein product, partial [marine sediment metagenome]
MSIWSKLIDAEVKLFIPHPKKEREKITASNLVLLLTREFG